MVAAYRDKKVVSGLCAFFVRRFIGGSTIEGDVTLADGSIVKKYTSHNYSGGNVNVNVSAMTKLHLDVYSKLYIIQN
jgi:hypothetical protein